jgi:hypothetical protein
MNHLPPSVLIRVHPWFLSLCLPLSIAAAPLESAVERPFMVWTAGDLRAIRARIEKDPWAKQELDAMQADSVSNRAVLQNYFLAAVAGDKQAEAYEAVVITNLCKPLFSPEYEELGESWVGNPGSHVNYDWAFRFDFFWNSLPDQFRRAFDDRFNAWARAGFGVNYDPQGWEHPRAMNSAMLALATGDRRLIRSSFEGTCGAKRYIDGMADGYFTAQGDNPGVHAVGGMLLWCTGAERLGIGETGFGYTGASGGSMRRLMEGYFMAGDPRVDIPGGAPFYGRAAMTLSPRLRGGEFIEFFTRYTAPGTAAAQGSTPSRLGFALPDLRHPRDVFRAPIVVGRLPDRPGGWPWILPFRNSVFYGIDRTPRSLVGKPEIEYNKGADPLSMGIQLPLAFELAHKLWPDAGFDYFLARMDMRDSDTYYPSLFWNISPFPKAKAKGPAVKSVVFPALGMALLRSQEGPEFWDSPAPYAVLRLAEGLGAEIAPSALSLHSFQAFNRPIYRHITPMAPGATGGADRGVTHNTVVVDNMPRAGTGKGTVRQQFHPEVKFAAARSTPYEYKEWVAGDKPFTSNLVTKLSGLAAGVEMERSLALTRDYLLDVFFVSSGTEHTYDWLIHAPGSAAPDDSASWKPTSRLDSTLGMPVQNSRSAGGAPLRFTLKNTFGDQHFLDPEGKTWSLNVVQTAMADDPARTVMGADWYNRKVGARVTMLGEPGTAAFYAREIAPRRLTRQEDARIEEILHPRKLKERDGNYDKGDQEATEIAIRPATGQPPKTPDASAQADKTFNPVGEATPTYPETGGVALIAERKAATTMFVAVHEPFAGMMWKIDGIARIAQTNDAVAVAIRGKGVEDRAMVRLGPDADKEIALGDGAESFKFKGFAYIRIAADRVTACGDIASLRVKVQGSPRLVVNGKDAEAAVRDGFLAFGQ